MRAPSEFSFVVAIYPNARGIAFVVFEGPLSLIDWGTRGARHTRDHARLLGAAASLFEHYWPPILVMQDMSALGTNRCDRMRALNEAIAHLADERGIPTSSHSRAEVRQVFAAMGATTKATIADTVAVRVPLLRLHLPPPRKAWMSEHARMGVFDAAALALTFFSNAGVALGTQSNIVTT